MSIDLLKCLVLMVFTDFPNPKIKRRICIFINPLNDTKSVIRCCFCFNVKLQKESKEMRNVTFQISPLNVFRWPQVTHEDNLPSEIAFAVRVAPSHGFLRRFVEAEERYIGTKQLPVRTFTQDDINSGNIQYVQVEPNKLNDTFVLDATNGVTDVGNIRVSVDVIPLLIPLHVTNFTLTEGATKALTQDVLKVTNRHFSGIDFLYILVEPPHHGHIEHSRYPGVPITTFTRRQVRNSSS